MTRLSIYLASLAAIAVQASPALAQSERAGEVANCNASFRGCSGGGSAVPFGDMGSGGLELMLVAGVLLVLAWGPIRRSMMRG